ncbi:MAG TPA: hypothetical protein VMF14_06935 [Solirubrobacteraceae bacterium]|nr:hypothetical protein [Solirubrobacteraceae bacterium]
MTAGTVTAGAAGAVGWAALTAVVAASTAFWAAVIPAWASAAGDTGNSPACARWGRVIATAAIRTATAVQSAPRMCRPRLAIVYDGP